VKINNKSLGGNERSLAMADSIQIAQVTSSAQPQSGQKNRSSGDFSTEGVPGGYSKFLWKISGSGVNPTAIQFDVMKDKSAGIDPTIFSNLTDGSVTDIYQDRQLYIANPKGATSNFIVTVYATN
jgi:hypothetical protein